jgi:hypothetical protein
VRAVTPFHPDPPKERPHDPVQDAAATFVVGPDGDAFGVADNTVMTVMDLLLAADAQAVNGVLYNGNINRRNKANRVFSAVNGSGNI